MLEIIAPCSIMLVLLAVVIYAIYFRWSVSIPDYMAARHYRFGKPTTEGPISGKRVIVIPEIDQLVLIDKRIQRSSLKKVPLITKERQGMSLSITIIWKPTDAAKTIECIRPEDIEPTFFKIIESVIKSECTKMSVEEILEKSTVLEKNIKSSLQSMTESWGITVTSSNISNIVVNNDSFMQNMARPREIELEKAAKLAEISEEQEIMLKNIEKEKVSKMAEIESEKIVAAKKEEMLSEIKSLECRRDAMLEELNAKTISITAQNKLIKERAEITSDAERIKSEIMAETEALAEKLRVINSFSKNATNFELIRILPDLYKNLNLGNVTLFETSGNGDKANGFNFMSNIVGSAYSIMEKFHDSDNSGRQGHQKVEELIKLKEMA